jgi:hypothetical protein
MCYSAQRERDWRKDLLVFGSEATINLEDFIKKHWWCQHEFPSMKIPKSVDAWFSDPKIGMRRRSSPAMAAGNEVSALKRELLRVRKIATPAWKACQCVSRQMAISRGRVEERTVREWKFILDDARVVTGQTYRSACGIGGGSSLGFEYASVAILGIKGIIKRTAKFHHAFSYIWSGTV